MMATGSAQKQADKKPKVKRKPKNALTLAERISVIKEYDRVHNTRKLAKAYGCGRTQIQNILKRKNDYLEQWSNNADPNKMRCKQSARLVILGAVVCEWIQRSRRHGLRINDSQILKAGHGVAKLMNHRDFRATETWLKRLKKLFKIYNLEPIPVCNTTKPKESLNLLDILLEFKNKEKLREYLPPSYIRRVYDTLEADDFRKNATDGRKSSHVKQQVIILKDDNVSQTSTDDRSLNEVGIDENCKYVLSFDEYQTSTGNDGLLTEVEIIEDSSNVLSFEVQHSDGNIVVKPKMNDKPLNTKDFNTATTSKEIKSEMVETEESTEKESNISISSYREALNHLGPIEQFALFKEDIRAVGIINQLENLFAERMKSSSN